MVGGDGEHAAWLLAQHADSDPEFQRICLDLVTQAVACGEALPTELAYLTDRVLLAEGKPQEYGTQFKGHKGRWVPQWLRGAEKGRSAPCRHRTRDAGREHGPHRGRVWHAKASQHHLCPVRGQHRGLAAR